MTTETIEWYTPEEQMPQPDASLLGMFNVHGTSLCFECFYNMDEDIWIISDFADDLVHFNKNPTTVPNHWCYIPQGPNDSTLAG